MDQVRRAAWMLGLAWLTPSCIANSPELRCGAGTTLNAGRCVAPPTLGASGVVADACGTGTHEANGFCLPDGPEVASTEGCQADPRVMHFEGNDFVYTGTMSVTEAAWQDLSEARSIYVRLEIGEFPGLTSWSLQFESRLLEFDLIPGTYELAERAAFASPGHPGIEITGDGRACGTASGRFQIHDIAQGTDGKLDRLLLSFEQRCLNSPTLALTGCLRFQP